MGVASSKKVEAVYLFGGFQDSPRNAPFFGRTDAASSNVIVVCVCFAQKSQRNAVKKGEGWFYIQLPDRARPLLLL